MWTFTDEDGAVRDLTGYTVKLVLQRIGQTAVELDGTLSGTPAAEDHALYQWVPADLATAGTYVWRLWVGDGTSRYSSPLHIAQVLPTLGAAPPAI